jgi:hypothetical protein
MSIARMLGISPFLAALAIHSASTADFGAAAREADVIEQRLSRPQLLAASGVRSDVDDPSLHGDHHSVSTAVRVKFCQNGLYVRFDGALGYPEVRRDCLVGSAGGHVS